MTPEIKICFAFPNDSLTYTIENYDVHRKEIRLRSIDGDCIRHEDAEVLQMAISDGLEMEVLSELIRRHEEAYGA